MMPNKKKEQIKWYIVKCKKMFEDNPGHKDAHLLPIFKRRFNAKEESAYS